jgi:predicted DNA binding CopG/RHH family protein
VKKKKNDQDKELLKSYNTEEWKSVDNLVEEINRAQEYARNTMKLLRKSKRINIRLSALDLAGIQTIAAKEGLPYQSLISSILHKYVSSNK